MGWNEYFRLIVGKLVSSEREQCERMIVLCDAASLLKLCSHPHSFSFPNNSRENVGVMFQKTMIYQGTIRDNILFGQPEQPGAVEDAARAAEIAEVIERLPEKYDTVIGGDALAGMSGGQLQRVCMARALYRKPSVLLLDEGKLCDNAMNV